MALLDFQLVTKVFPGRVKALDSFTLAAGEHALTVLVGPSGAGKTTVLRIAAGLERATSGSVRLDGKPIDDWPPRKRDMAMAFQQPAIYPHLTVRKNAAFALSTRRTPREEIERRIAKTAADLEISHLLDRLPDTLSGGEAQRAGLLRALVRRPKALLLDEPFASLDAPLREELRRVFCAVQRADRITTLLVTHDQQEALAMADRLVVIRAGKIAQAGPPQEIYHQPANRFVAQFIGSPPMNFIQGALAHRDGRVWFDCPDVRLAAAPAMQASLLQSTDRAAWLGIRAESIRVAPNADTGAGQCIQAAVTEREFRGDHWLVRYRSKQGVLLCGIVRDDPPPATGENVCLNLDTERACYFGADEQGLRL